MNSRILGIIGAILLIVGIFCPIVSIFGINLSYFRIFRMESGGSDGLIIGGLGVIALVIALLNKTRLLIVPGVLALGLLALDFFRFKAQMSEATPSVDNMNPGSSLSSVIQLQWGWGVLLFGALLLLLAGIIKKSFAARAVGYGAAPPPPSGYNPGPGQPPPPLNR
jgi:hypothetical protein